MDRISLTFENDKMKNGFRDKIIKEAAMIFNHYSYKKTTITDIANAVGKGKSSIYYYFKGKDEIFIAVLRKEADMLRNELLTAVEACNEPIEKIRTYVLTRMEVYKKASNLYKTYASGMAIELPFIDELIDEYNQLELSLLTDIIEQGCKSNKFVINNPALTALAIVTALKSLEKPLFNGNDDSVDSTIKQLLEILLMGIVKR